MKLMHGTIRPGKVLEIIETGAIKVSAPGLFTDVDGIEVLPPVYPWPFGHHPNSYSCPKIDEEVWVINFADNPLQLHYIRKDNLAVGLQDMPLSDETQNLEVIVNREFEDSKWAILYFSTDDGWVMKKGEEGVINLRSDGSILLKTGFDKRVIDICEDSISLGSEGKAADSAILYSKWKEWADTLVEQLQNTLANAASASPYTASLAPAFQAAAMTLKPKIEPVESKHVSITDN